LINYDVSAVAGSKR